MKFIIRLEPPYFDFVQKNPLVFNGWKRLSNNSIEMDCEGNGQTEEKWLKSYVFPQVQDFFRKLEPTGMILSEPTGYGEIITPSGAKIPLRFDLGTY